ncbi:hypothetical protein [Luteibacter sp. SG786]|uniref:hypothetical protein n=1 Tax=Luteibacter sp. SG786 TaxID=2587130 RepID=UPI001422FB90|nr:hypothetical protein [Luteibacter sp. SG786]NII56227.1 hypothetical protein [Luteibacter sp. SG786]
MSKEAASPGQYVLSRAATIRTWERRRQAGEPEAPMLVDPSQAPGNNILYPGAAPDSGVVIRVPVYENMAAGQRLILNWEGVLPFSTSKFVRVPGNFLDFSVPKDVLPDADSGRPECYVSYIVQEPGKPDRASGTTIIHVTQEFPAPPPVTVPAAPDGELDFSTIDREIGLPVQFPDAVIVGASWLVYARDGHPKDLVGFRAMPGETVNLWRELLDQVESGDEARIWYMGATDFISPSKMVAIRAL